MSISSNMRFSRSSLASGNSYAPRNFTVNGKVAASGADITLSLTFNRILGKGTFGCIEQAQINDSKDSVAVKRVYQDPRYKNRELNILLRLTEHPNLVKLLYYYYTQNQSGSGAGGTSNASINSARTANTNATTHASGSNAGATDDIYLHLVMECFPESLADLIIRYSRRSVKIPMTALKLYTYQMMRALGYIHIQNICHRDIKSSNLLVNEATGQVKLCDFGSAKEIVQGQTNVAYISSRYYRAPELIFGADQYDCAIDIWSAGCVVAEVLLRKCLFMGTDGVDQLAEIIKVLGTPTTQDVQSMNPRYSNYSFPNVPRCPLKLYLPMETPPGIINLLGQMLVYKPSGRVKPLPSLCHAAFEELRTPENLTKYAKLHLFEFLPQEISAEPQLSNISIGEYQLKSADTTTKGDNTNNANSDGKTAGTGGNAADSTANKNSANNKRSSTTTTSQLPQAQQNSSSSDNATNSNQTAPSNNNTTHSQPPQAAQGDEVASNTTNNIPNSDSNDNTNNNS